MCTVAIQLQNLAIAPLLQRSFLCFGTSKIAILLFSSTAASALSSIEHGSFFYEKEVRV